MKQKGFTLLELLVAMPIGAAILIVLTYSFFQIAEGRVDITQKSVAMSDIDNATHWLARDLVMAQEVNLTDGAPPTSSLIISWSDLTHWALDEGTIDYSISYALSGTELIRTYNGVAIVIGRYITDVGFSIDDRVFTVTLTSQPGLPGSTVTKTFSSEMRTDIPP
ncbi:type II secretion system protein J [Chloroflexota bacterium]